MQPCDLQRRPIIETNSVLTVKELQKRLRALIHRRKGGRHQLFYTLNIHHFQDTFLFVNFHKKN